MATQTSTIELQPISQPAQAVLSPKHEPHYQVTSSANTSNEDHDLPSLEQSSPPPEAVSAKPRWNHPRYNIARFAAIFFAFINFGMNDACYGALLPYVSLPL